MFDRGQRLDWFGSDEILLWAGLALLGYYLFVVHSLNTPSRSSTSACSATATSWSG